MMFVSVRKTWTKSKLIKREIDETGRNFKSNQENVRTLPNVLECFTESVTEGDRVGQPDNAILGQPV